METRKAKTRTVAMVVLCGILVYALIATGGSLEPSAPPGPTMKTLDEIYDKLQIIESKLRFPRFTQLRDGTVRDNATGLIWLKDANCFGAMNWYDAMDAAANLADGPCGLSDGSVAGDWRLPSIEEFNDLVDTNYTHPALCNASGLDHWSQGNAFNNVQSYHYWSSSAYEGSTTHVWGVFLSSGHGNNFPKSHDYLYVWPVRGE